MNTTVGKNITVVAEIGTSHGGSLAKAAELIRAASESGADIVKTQVVIADEILHPQTGTVNLPGGPTPLYDVFKSLEQPAEFYQRFGELCRENGVGFLASPFGLESARILKGIPSPYLKIASPEANHLPLLTEVSGYRRKIILSAGVTRLSDVERALDILPDDTVLMHCVTSYPAPEEEYNLRLLESYQRIFGVEVGISDHSLDPLLVPLAAVACGATFVEKHFTLSRSDKGLDDPIALEPEDFLTMSRNLKNSRGQSRDHILDALRKRAGKRRVNAVLGDGVKRLAPAEEENYGRTNRSVHALRDLAAGTVISDKNTALLRTEKVLRPGLEPVHYADILGTVLTRDVEAGQGIVWDDVLGV